VRTVTSLSSAPARSGDLDLLVADLLERAGVGAHQQHLELRLQLLALLGRGAAPGRAGGRGRHAREVDVGHDLAVDHADQAVDVAALDRLVAPDDGQHLVGQAADHRVGRLVGGPRRGRRQQRQGGGGGLQETAAFGQAHVHRGSVVGRHAMAGRPSITGHLGAGDKA
jgi:hypothetical protein